MFWRVQFVTLKREETWGKSQFALACGTANVDKLQMERDIIPRDDPISDCEIGFAQDFFLFQLKMENSVIWERIQNFRAGASRHGPPRAGPCSRSGPFSSEKFLKLSPRKWNFRHSETKSLCYNVSFFSNLRRFSRLPPPPHPMDSCGFAFI